MRKSSAKPRDATTPDHGRNAKRYDIGLSLRFTIRRRGRPPMPGVGRTINVSSSGMLFHTDCKLAPGDSIIAGVDWPAVADDGAALVLLLTGYVVRFKGQSVAISISRNELVPVEKLTEYFDTFAKRMGGAANRRPILAPTVLVDEDEAACSVVAAIVYPQGWQIERVDPAAARRILDAGFPPVSLLVTRTVGILENVSPEIPIVLTVPERAALPAEISRLPLLAIIRKPLIYGDLRAVIRRLCANQARLQTTGTSA